MPAHLRPAFEILQTVYPEGVPESDYLPLLAALVDELAEENLALLVAELVDDELVVVASDAAAAQSSRRPASEAVAAVREQLEAAGWEFEGDDG